MDIGSGKNEVVETEIFGGEVGIIFDARGRQPFILSKDSSSRVEYLKKWSISTLEYPVLEGENV